VLTVEEWSEFRKTDEYLWMVTRTEGYRGKAMDELIKRGTKRREEAWKIALDMAESIVASDLAEAAMNVPEEGRRMAVRQLAEKLLVEQDTIPLTYTAWSDCQQCGRVPVPEGSDEVLAICPWCTK
jgi:hypothetical protein